MALDPDGVAVQFLEVAPRQLPRQDVNPWHEWVIPAPSLGSTHTAHRRRQQASRRRPRRACSSHGTERQTWVCRGVSLGLDRVRDAQTAQDLAGGDEDGQGFAQLNGQGRPGRCDEHPLEAFGHSPEIVDDVGGAGETVG